MSCFLEPMPSGSSYGTSDFKEFLVGFLLTTKGSMEEKLDYTFQLYGKHTIVERASLTRDFSTVS